MACAALWDFEGILNARDFRGRGTYGVVGGDRVYLYFAHPSASG